MTQTLTFTGRLVVTNCWCGIRHAVPQELHDFQERQHRNGERVTSIYCPLGHEYVPSGEGEAEKLRRRLESERERAGRLAARADQAEASARAYKGAATRARKRAKAGVCPCCNRTFKQLAAHMKTKHPGFDPDAAPKGAAA